MVGVSRKSSSSALLPSLLPLLLLSTFCHPNPILHWSQFYSQEVTLVPVLQPGGHPGSSSTVRRSPWFQ